MMDIEKTLLNILIYLNNSIYNQIDYDKRLYTMQIYNKIFSLLHEEMKAKINLPYPIPMKIDLDLMTKLMNTEAKEVKQRNVFIEWIRGKIWK